MRIGDSCGWVGVMEWARVSLGSCTYFFLTHFLTQGKRGGLTYATWEV